MKRFIVGLAITTAIFSWVNTTNAQVLEVQKPAINNNDSVKIIKNDSISLPSQSKGKPELDFPLSKLVLIKYSEEYLPGVIDLEYQDSVGQRLGIEDPSPQVLSVWHKNVVYLTVNKPNGCSSAFCSYSFYNPKGVELMINDKVFTLEEHTSNLAARSWMFTTYTFTDEAKAALQNTDSERVKLRIKIGEGEFVTTPIGKKTIKTWQAV